MLLEWTPAGLHDFMQRFVEREPRNVALLDVGCGTGAWLSRLQRLGFTDLTGIDIAPPSLDGITTLRADLNNGELPTSRRFDVVTSFEVFEHVDNAGKFLDVIAKALSPTGRAIITSPNVHALRYRLKYALRNVMPSFDAKGAPDHVSPLLLPAVERLAKQRGMHIAHVSTYPERGTVMFGKPMQALSAIARIAMPDPLPGDSICISLRRSIVQDGHGETL